MKNYKDSDYARNKFSDGIVYRFADRIVEITLKDYLAENPDKTVEDFMELKALTEAGLELYLKHGFSDTVTAVKVPHGLKDSDILRLMKEKHGIMIAGCFGCLAGKVIRIGHMGENANISDMELVMDALQGSLEELGLELSCNMRQNFLRFF